MAANVKRYACYESFNNVFVDDFNISFSILELSAFDYFNSVLFSRSL